MNYRQYGNTELNVSRICYGTMRYASKTGDRDDQSANATRAIEEAIERGINFFHSSHEYGTRWLTGEVLGRHPKRHDIHHIIKINVPDWGEARFDPSVFRFQVEQALRELKTDRIAIVQHLHRGTLDPKLGYCAEGEPKRLSEYSEVTRALREVFEKLREEGKVGYLATFPYTVGYARHAIDSGDFSGVVAYFNALETEMLDLFPALEKQGMGFIGIRPLAAGLLTDRRVDRARLPDDDRLTGNEWDRLYDQLSALREELSTQPESWTKFAIRCSLAHPRIVSTVIGINTPEQLQTAVEAVETDTDDVPDTGTLEAAHRICTTFREKYGVKGALSGVPIY